MVRHDKDGINGEYFIHPRNPGGRCVRVSAWTDYYDLIKTGETNFALEDIVV